VFDLVTTQIGGRGGGEELFSLERGVDYYSKVLLEVADDLEPWVLSEKMRIKEDDIRARGDALVEMVMDRLRKIANGRDNFCWYCGTDGVDTRCSKCKTAHFCRSCQLLGWKYHKVWCKSLLSQ
jgi:MYND finger